MPKWNTCLAVALLFTMTACAGATIYTPGGDDDASCVSGSIDCSCRLGGACDDGLVCRNKRCTPVESSDGDQFEEELSEENVTDRIEETLTDGLDDEGEPVCTEGAQRCDTLGAAVEKCNKAGQWVVEQLCSCGRCQDAECVSDECIYLFSSCQDEQTAVMIGANEICCAPYTEKCQSGRVCIAARGGCVPPDADGDTAEVEEFADSADDSPSESDEADSRDDHQQDAAEEVTEETLIEPCVLDEDCDDTIACTYDNCDPNLGCIHTVDASVCDDNIACTRNVCTVTQGCIYEAQNSWCNQAVGEYCDPVKGCVVPGACGVDADCPGDGMICCKNACIDPSSNHEHCGDCDTVCGKSQVCFFGVCRMGTHPCVLAYQNLIVADREESYTYDSAVRTLDPSGISGCPKAPGPDLVWAFQKRINEPFTMAITPQWAGWGMYEVFYLVDDCFAPTACSNTLAPQNQIDGTISMTVKPGDLAEGIYYIFADWTVNGSGAATTYKAEFSYDEGCRSGDYSAALLALAGLLALRVRRARPTRAD